MAEIQLSDQPTLTAAELADAIIALQTGTPKAWRKVTPNELIALLGLSTGGSNLVGQLLATCSIPVGSHDHVTVFEWTVETGVTIVSVIELYATAVGNRNIVTNGALEVPLTRQGRTTQIGWFVEITNGDTIVYERLFPFNDYVFAPPSVEAQAQTTVTTDGLQISIAYIYPSQASGIVYPPAFVVSNYQKPATSLPTVIAAGNDYQLKIYVAEN